MNRRLFKCFSGLAIATIILLIWYAGFSSKSSNACPYDRESQRKIVNLAYRVHHHLAELDLTHCLCYGALWSALQKGTILPWEGDVKFCILNQDLLHFEENFLIRYFHDKKLLLTYKSGEGYFSITNISSPGDMDVKLIVFEALDGELLRRVGWKRRVLPPNCEMTPSLECFPSRLLKSPLPETRFGSETLPVPREGIEILKYQYPESWWLDILPQSCR